MSEKNRKDEENPAVDSSEHDTGEESTPEEVTQKVQLSDLEENTDNVDLLGELEKTKNDFMYLRADFDNFKKSAIKERSQLVKYGNERLLVDLVDVLDNFEHALNMEITPENIESFQEGVAMIQKELFNSLEKYGLTKLESKGKAFDPTVHEALSSEPSEEVEPGHITQVFKEAYKLHDRVIRPAQVVVAKEIENQE